MGSGSSSILGSYLLKCDEIMGILNIFKNHEFMY